MKTTNKCALAAFAVGTALAGGSALLLPGAHPAVYFVVFALASGGAYQAALTNAANKKAVGDK